MHKTVLLEETCEGLHITKGSRYLDATLGAGGHTIEILRRGGQVLAMDQDEDMIEIAKANLKDFSENTEACPFFKIVKANFEKIDQVARDNDYIPVSGIVMDLGISSLHLDEFNRGFSFSEVNSELDMRLDKSLGVKASDLVNSLPEKQLMKLFSDYISWKESSSLVNKIIEKRRIKKFESVGDFLEIFPEKKVGNIHPATKAFMALRIAVNMEIDILGKALPHAFSILEKGGRLAVISFHSGEDVIVKRYFKSMADSGLASLVNKSPIVPKKAELENNPRSRSAKLRILEKNEIYKSKS